MWGGCPEHSPSTRLISCCVQVEGLLKVVEAHHLLIERVQLDAASVGVQAEGFRGLRVSVSEGSTLPQDSPRLWGFEALP